jgi:ABC-type sulfate transport system permease component
VTAARPAWFPLALTLALTVVLAFLALPVVAIFADAGPAALLDALADPAALDALRLSLLCSLAAIAIIVVVGTPAAYALATRRFPGRSALVTLIELPLVLPPAVAGIGLLAALGPNGILGGLVESTGARLVLETSGVIVALTFVAAPFYLRRRRRRSRRSTRRCSTPPARSARRRPGRSPGWRSRPLGRACPPASPSPGAARWASSARRSCSRARSEE